MSRAWGRGRASDPMPSPPPRRPSRPRPGPRGRGGTAAAAGPTRSSPHPRPHPLVTDGRLDIVEPPENSRIIARRIPGAKLTLYRGAGHAHLFQFNGRYAGEVNGFLAVH
jgi:pimeloyl-ACP methyl ester carboxylesterase